MVSKRNFMISSLVLAVTFTIGFKINTHSVKADAAIKSSQQGVVVKSAEVNTGKVIVVPKKKDKKSTNSTNTYGEASLSRGGSGRFDVVSYAYGFMGIPYVWGASGSTAFDCSGFTAYVFRAFGVSLPHYTGSQFNLGSAVSRANLSSGDLVFFNTVGSISHVGIYVGGNKFIHASSGSHKVTVSSLDNSYYSTRYAGARRILR